MIWRALLMPLGGVALGLGALFGGRPGQILLITGVCLFGVAAILVVAD